MPEVGGIHFERVGRAVRDVSIAPRGVDISKVNPDSFDVLPNDEVSDD